jgi:hypothetical protein
VRRLPQRQRRLADGEHTEATVAAGRDDRVNPSGPEWSLN